MMFCDGMDLWLEVLSLEAVEDTELDLDSRRPLDEELD
jgi:hypothetical protein